MKFFQAKGFALLLAVGCISIAEESSSAQDLARGEFVVGSQVVSDGVATPGSSLSGTTVTDGTVVADGSAAASVTSDGVTYVGDLSAAVVGGCIERGYGRPDLFYNFYTSGMCNRANAQMYLSPLPVPPNVGHTFFTYQPFYPHEMLYWHKDRFHNYYDNGRGMNRTRAVYYAPPVRQAASNLYWNYLRLPR